MIEEGLEVPELPTFDVELESDSDSSSTATDRKYFVCVFNISLWGGRGRGGSVNFLLSKWIEKLLVFLMRVESLHSLI